MLNWFFHVSVCTTAIRLHLYVHFGQNNQTHLQNKWLIPFSNGLY